MSLCKWSYLCSHLNRFAAFFPVVYFLLPFSLVLIQRNENTFFSQFCVFLLLPQNKRNEFLSLNHRTHIFTWREQVDCHFFSMATSSKHTLTQTPIFVCSFHFLSVARKCNTGPNEKKSHFHFHQHWHFPFNIFHLIALWLFHENESLVVDVGDVVAYAKLSS